MSKKEQVLLVALLCAALLAIFAILGWLAMDRSKTAEQPVTTEPKRPHLLASATSNPMEAVERAGTQTAEALLGTVEPMAAIPSGFQYWLPATNSDFAPRFVYDATLWALSDLRTLASLQISGCTLQLAGGHALGPGWSTEQSTFQAGDISFMTILAKVADDPRFVTYSAKNGTVFEISATDDFAQCQQAGERVLKTITLP